MEISNNIDELQEQVYTTKKQLQEIAELKKETSSLTETRTQLTKKINAIKTSIEEKEGVLYSPYMEQNNPQQTILFE